MQSPAAPGTLEKIQRINDICRRVLAAESLQEALATAVRSVVEEYGCDGACVALVEEGEFLTRRAHHGSLPSDAGRGSRQRIGEGFVGRAAATRATVVCHDTAAGQGDVPPAPGSRAELCLPLICGDALVGVLDLHADRTGAFESDDVMLLETFARQLALVVDKARQVQAVERTRDYLENLITNAGDGILAIDRERRIIRWNRGCERILGHGASEMHGATYDSLRAPSSATGDIIGRGLGGMTLESVEDVLVCRDGRWIHVALTLSPIRDGQGAVEGVSLIVRDVTERRNLEENFRSMARQIRESEEKFLGLIERADDAILIVDPESGKVIQANASAEALTRDNRASLIGRPLHALHPETERGEVEARLSSVPEIGESAAVRLHLLRRGAEPLDVRVTPRRLNYGGRNLVQWLCRDISDRCRIEGEKERLQEQLIHSEKMSALSQLISSLAHELNNPLTGVIGYAELLASQAEDPRTARGLERVHAEAKRCHRIVQNLLTFAHQRRESDRALVSVNEVLDRTIEVRAYQLRVDSIRIQRDLQPDLPPVRANVDQLQQALLNVLVNAHQAIASTGRRGAIRVTTARLPGKVRIEIADDGPGIRPADQKRIFEPFFTTRRPGHGLGLGLSICQGIIEEHDGSIRAVSTPGQGTTLRIDLPEAVQEAGAATA